MSATPCSTLLTAGEVARLLRISKRSFETLISSGLGPDFARIGRLRRWKPEEVEAWLARQSNAKHQQSDGKEPS